MASWFVFEPARSAPDTLEAADGAVFVKDGFSLGAFLLTPFWLLWRRMWLVFLAWLALMVALAVLTRALSLDEKLSGIVSLLAGLCFALEANALRGWTMRRQGWRFTGIACGRTLAEAEQRHFEDRIFAAPAGPEQQPPPPGPWTSALRRPGSPPGVLGVFPEPHGTQP